jgi:hypothetical protein
MLDETVICRFLLTINKNKIKIYQFCTKIQQNLEKELKKP